MAATFNYTFETNLIDDFLSEELISPQKQFQAIKTKLGLSVLLGVSGEGNLEAIIQQSGEKTGWSALNLSTSLNGSVKTFAVSQNSENLFMNLSIVVTASGKDTLYQCTGIDLDQKNWNDIQWQSIPYNDTTRSIAALNIQKVFMFESGEMPEGASAVVDVVNTHGDLDRFYIENKDWNYMNIGAQISKDIASATGFQKNIPGIYTLGEIGKKPYLNYLPLYNPFDKSVPPNEVVLECPSDAVTLASVVQNDSSELFVAGARQLYYYPESQQKEGIAPTAVIQNNALFEGISELFAYVAEDEFRIWGLNRANQVFYTSCPVSDASNAASWSPSMVILDKVDAVSPYVNAKSNSNVFFALPGEQKGFIKAEQSTGTSLWKTTHLHFKEGNDVSTIKRVKAYSTVVKVTGENEAPAIKQKVLVSSNTQAAMIINGLHYVLSPTPIPIETDSLGSITCIEKVNDLVSTTLVISSETGEKKLTIAPMQKPIAKMLSYNTANKLHAAVITQPNGTTIPLLADTTNVAKIAVLIGQLNEANQALHDSSNPSVDNAVDTSGIGALAGDVFSWIESVGAESISIIKKEGSSLYHFVASIAGKTFHVLLDCVEKIGAAIQSVFKLIKTAIDEILDFLKHLFDWKDIWNTHKIVAAMMQNGLHFIDQKVVQTSDTILEKSTHYLDEVQQSWDKTFENLPGQDKTIQDILAKDTGITKELHSYEMDWLLYHLQHSISSDDSAAMMQANALVTDNLVKRLEEICTGKMAPLVKGLIDNNVTTDPEKIMGFFAPNKTLGDYAHAFKQFGDAAAGVIHEVLELVVSEVKNAFEQISQCMQETIEVPFLKEIYSWVAGVMGDDEEFNFLNATALLFCVPAVPFSKALNGGDNSISAHAATFESPELFNTLLGNLLPQENVAMSVAETYDDIRKIYYQFIHPLGRIIGYANSVFRSTFDAVNLNILTNSISLIADGISKLLILNLPTSKLKRNEIIGSVIMDLTLGYDWLVSSILNFIPQPVPAVCQIILKTIKFFLFFGNHIYQAVVTGLWEPILIDFVQVAADLAKNFGKILTGTGEDGAPAGGFPAALVPFGIPLIGGGLILELVKVGGQVLVIDEGVLG